MVLPVDDAGPEMTETKIIRKASPPKTQSKPAASKVTTVKPDENPTKVIRKVVTKPVASQDTDKDKTRTSGKKTQAASARAATARISATRTAANLAAKAQDEARRKREALSTNSRVKQNREHTKPQQQTKKKILWPYMIMIVSIVFIASLVTFLYLIRSSQNRFFMAIRDKDAPVLEVTDLDIYNDQTVTVDDFITVCEDGHITVGRSDEKCSVCGKPITDKLTRVVGFLTNTKNWHEVRRKHDFPDRKFY